jgi:hypothetical protein
MFYENFEVINYEKIRHIRNQSYAFVSLYKWLNRVITIHFEKKSHSLA